ncbi:hypothetical protein MAMC_00648 [Methylacidimicrobium cyclopophantes]|jgi:type I restriction-modification system DNA methylase subunit|uniref:DNA methylase adenine-specific domain-containing protein n=1 Tax=Methylacidimicrobium cyclopophantes TaxID=1041766 RepID=A0A5E6M9B9_9BACT|nr:hypothetical protein MAMC_00648 [Methylacidimicrobium cyclopophantes]
MMDANEAILALVKEPRKRVGLIQERFAQELAGALSTVNHSENGNHLPHRFLLRRFPELREEWDKENLPGQNSGQPQGIAPTYADILGFCKSATLEEIRKHGYVLTPGRYVGAEAAPDDGEPFEEKMARLVARLREQQAEAAKLDAAIAANLKELGYGR